MPLKMGQKVQDSLTEFKGAVIAKVVYLNGCISYEVQSEKLTAEGELVSEWFDEQRLTKQSKAKIGGPHNRPSKPHRPK